VNSANGPYETILNPLLVRLHEVLNSFIYLIVGCFQTREIVVSTLYGVLAPTLFNLSYSQSCPLKPTTYCQQCIEK
jgi:hypothetical protein